MKKAIALLTISLCITALTFGQVSVLTKKDSRKILENAWNCVKTNDTAGFIKLWVLDNMQWPYHNGTSFSEKDLKYNFSDFKTFFDSALVHNLKFDDVQCDTVELNDDHRSFSRYYITAWFKYNNNRRKGFAFYMQYVGDKWLIRFSPDYLNERTKK